VDYQIIDVLNDHLCYVVTDKKTPWHLPKQNDFMLVTKVVITHVAKSRCKMVIYTRVDWSKPPTITRGTQYRRLLVGRRSLTDCYQGSSRHELWKTWNWTPLTLQMSSPIRSGDSALRAGRRKPSTSSATSGSKHRSLKSLPTIPPFPRHHDDP